MPCKTAEARNSWADVTVVVLKLHVRHFNVVTRELAKLNVFPRTQRLQPCRAADHYGTLVNEIPYIMLKHSCV